MVYTYQKMARMVGKNSILPHTRVPSYQVGDGNQVYFYCTHAHTHTHTHTHTQQNRLMISSSPYILFQLFSHIITLSFYRSYLNLTGESVDVIIEFVPTSVRTYDYALSVDILGALRVLTHSYV